MGEQNKFSVSIVFTPQLERFSYDLELKTHKQNRNNKRTEIEEFDWFIKRIQTHVAFGWLSKCSSEKTSLPRTFQKSIELLRFDIILQPAATRLANRTTPSPYQGWKTKSPCIDLVTHWLIKQIMNTYQNHFSRSYENRSIVFLPKQLRLRYLIGYSQGKPPATGPQSSTILINGDRQ